MDATSHFARSITEAARTLNEPRSLDDTWQTIVDVACNAVTGFDHVGIATLERTGEIKTRAFTGDLVVPLDQVQCGLSQGPCSEVLRSYDAMCVSSLKTDRRWPGYVPVARDWGVRSQMAVRLYLGKGTLAAINFYSTTSDDVSDTAQMIARQFAIHAALALGHAQEVENFNEAMQSRQIIGQATGILMHRYDMNEARAYAYLKRASSYSNIKLRDVAQELVERHGRGPFRFSAAGN